MIYRLIMIIGIIVTLTGCFRVSSGTEIKINNVTQVEYKDIKEDVEDIITKLEPPFDCEYDKKYWKANRDNGELICRGDPLANIYVDIKEKNISLFYNGTYAFWMPTKEIITDEHNKMQKLFLELATKYKREYEDVEVIFYHHDLPKEGRKIF